MLQILILVFFCGLLPGVLYKLSPLYVTAILKDIRLLRILHYVLLSFLGVALCVKMQIGLAFSFNGIFLNRVLLYSIALTYAAVFAIVTNNLEDLETDKISNTNRPLVRLNLNHRTYYRAGIFCLFCALALALAINMEAFVSVMLISFGYYVYSCRPFRLKRFTLLAKFLIGFNSWIAAVTGYAIAGGNWQHFPISWSVFLLLPMSLSANFIDLKDTEGDRAMGIKTLPVVLGETMARHFIAAFTLCTYVMGGILLNIWWIYPINALMCTAHLWFLYKKPYSEKPVFLIYLSSLAGLCVLLLIF